MVDATRTKCMCRHCIKERGDTINGLPYAVGAMIVCPQCGNKRCPHATHHSRICTSSNDRGQPGSIYQ